MEYEDKGNTKWSLVANPESLKGRSGRESVRWGRGTLHLERTKNLRQLFYLIKSYPPSDRNLYCVHFYN